MVLSCSPYHSSDTLGSVCHERRQLLPTSGALLPFSWCSYRLAVSIPMTWQLTTTSSQIFVILEIVHG